MDIVAEIKGNIENGEVAIACETIFKQTSDFKMAILLKLKLIELKLICQRYEQTFDDCEVVIETTIAKIIISILCKKEETVSEEQWDKIFSPNDLIPWSQKVNPLCKTMIYSLLSNLQ